MSLSRLVLIAAAQLLVFATVNFVGATQKPVPNQDNVSTRADETVSNPKNEKMKKTAASKRAQLRKERDAQRKVKMHDGKNN